MRRHKKRVSDAAGPIVLAVVLQAERAVSIRSPRPAEPSRSVIGSSVASE